MDYLAIIFGIIFVILGLWCLFSPGESQKTRIAGLVGVIMGALAIYISIDEGSNDDSYYERNNEYNYDQGSNINFRGSQTGYTGECKICDCEAYDRSPDGICECGHYKTDHKWHN